MAYGVITEQGDLGLGFNEVSSEEEKSILESQKSQDDNKSSVEEK